MAQQKMRVEYADGREHIVRITPKALALTESQFNGIGDHTKLRASMYLAWASLHHAGMESADYESWLDSVVEVEDYEDEKKTTEGPTPPAPSPEPQSD